MQIARRHSGQYHLCWLRFLFLRFLSAPLKSRLISATQRKQPGVPGGFTWTDLVVLKSGAQIFKQPIIALRVLAFKCFIWKRCFSQDAINWWMRERMKVWRGRLVRRLYVRMVWAFTVVRSIRKVITARYGSSRHTLVAIGFHGPCGSRYRRRISARCRKEPIRVSSSHHR